MRRRRLAAEISGVVIAVACLPVRAQIYKCPDGDGHALQQAPCAGLGQSGGRLLVLPNGRPAPIADVAASGTDAPRIGRVLGRSPLPSANERSAPVAVASAASAPGAEAAKLGGVLGGTPLPSSEVARKRN